MHTATWQKLFRHLSTFASPPVPCEWPRHQRGPRARCPPPAHRPPAALPPTLRHGQAPAGRVQPAEGRIRHQKGGRQEHGKPPPSVRHSRSFTYPCSARRSKQRPMALISIFLPRPLRSRARRERRSWACREGVPGSQSQPWGAAGDRSTILGRKGASAGSPWQKRRARRDGSPVPHHQPAEAQRASPHWAERDRGFGRAPRRCLPAEPAACPHNTLPVLKSKGFPKGKPGQACRLPFSLQHSPLAPIRSCPAPAVRGYSLLGTGKGPSCHNPPRDLQERKPAPGAAGLIQMSPPRH